MIAPLRGVSSAKTALLVWLISFQSSLWGIAGDFAGPAVNTSEHLRKQNGTVSDTVQLLQTIDRNHFPVDCFILEDHYPEVHGVLTATLRFGPGGNAGPPDVKCIGSKKVTEIVGSLSVTGALSLTSILLPTLESVRGSLVFMQLPKLVTQTFRLNGLRSVGENLVIRHNEALSFVSLEHLLHVDRTFEVGSNRDLKTLSFSSLSLVGLHLLIDSNPGLEQLSAPGLKEIRYDLIIGGNDLLEAIDFPFLKKIGEDLVVYVLGSLRSIEFPVLSFVGEDVEFAHLVQLQQLSLPAVQFIGEDLEVHHCHSLESVSMPSLIKVQEDVEIHNLPLCASVSMPDLAEIDEDLEIYNMGALQALSLPSLKFIREDLILGGMAVASEVSMQQLNKVDGSFWLYNQPNLSEVDFANLATIGGKKRSQPPPSSCHYGIGDCDNEQDSEEAVYVTNNTRLEHFAMPRLVSVRSRYFAIFGNAALLFVRLPLLSKFRVPNEQNSCSLNSLFGVFRNEALTTLELNPALAEPNSWTLTDNAPGFCPSGPQWATCGGGTVSVEAAEEAIFGCQCQEEGFENSFLDGFCRQGECPAYAAMVDLGSCQTCFDADGCLVLSEAFQTVPDLQNGGETQAINGSIQLAGNGITCVKAGISLTSINGCLEIQGNGLLETIDFERLIFVSSITISGNVILNQIAAASLEKINLDLLIEGNPSLLEIQFPELNQVDGRLSLTGHASLQILELPALIQAGSFFVTSNVALDQFQVPNLVRTTSHLRMWQLNLTTIDLPSLERIGEDFVVSFCWTLELLTASVLVEIAEDLELYVLHSLSSITFPLLTQVGEDLEIYTNDALTRMRFGSLELIGEDLEFFDNTGILELDQNSFPSLEHVEEDFEVYLCAQLQSLDVQQLLRIDEDLLLFGNPTLKTVNLPQLEDVAAREGGGMLITDNLVLTRLELPSLKRVGNSTARMGSRDGSRDIRLYTGALVREVRGQEARPILIAHNPELLHIGFPQLEILRTGLWIQKNEKLEKIDLASLKRGVSKQFFVIRLNPVLGKGGLMVPQLEGWAPALVNLNCNSPDFCVQSPSVPWLWPWSCQGYHRHCPDPYFANRRCGRTAIRCTNVFYRWAMENSYDFEENVVQPWVSPSRFAAYTAKKWGYSYP